MHHRLISRVKRIPTLAEEGEILCVLLKQELLRAFLESCLLLLGHILKSVGLNESVLGPLILKPYLNATRCQPCTMEENGIENRQPNTLDVHTCSSRDGLPLGCARKAIDRILLLQYCKLLRRL